jgi:hypothetical protein
MIRDEKMISFRSKVFGAFAALIGGIFIAACTTMSGETSVEVIKQQ